jgi:hypothetical protein
VSGIGYLAVAYLLTAAAFGAYLLSLTRRRRSLERRLGQAERAPLGPSGPRAEDGSRD